MRKLETNQILQYTTLNDQRCNTQSVYFQTLSRGYTLQNTRVALNSLIEDENEGSGTAKPEQLESNTT